MDTFTQITLGAAVGEAVLGKKTGNKAILWGAVGGLIPDLDMIPAFFMDDVTKLTFHRGFSHSILFSIMLAPLAGYLIYRLHRKKISVGIKQWTILMFLALITHILLDCFTTYGTQLLNPFSSYGFAFNTISVIDPLYTIPLLICVIFVIFIKRTSNRRQVLNYIGLGISTLYLIFTVTNKFYVTSVFEKSLTRQNISFNRISTYPTIFNNILWRCIAESNNNFYVGYYSLLDATKNIPFKIITKNHYLIQEIKDEVSIKNLNRFSKGSFSIVKKDNYLIFNDMRYGKIPGIDSEYVFSYKISLEKYNNRILMIKRNHPKNINKATFEQFVERIFGSEIKQQTR